MTIRVPAVFCCLIATAYAAIQAGENAYLPPKDGYNYPRPNVPFPSGPNLPPPRPPRPVTVPTRPPQATVPPPFSPSPSPYRPPSGPPAVPFKPTTPPFRPTSPPYRPSSPPARPQGTSAPGYLPPQQPPSYRPPATSPTFRPQPQPPRPIPTQPRPIPTQPRPTSPPFRPAPSYGPPTTGPRQPTGPEGKPFQTFGENDHLLVPHSPGNPFDFKYEVKDEFGNDYSHNAINDGDTTNGEYRVQLPDGRTQVVKYTANWASGFHAKISYEGQPTFKPSGGGFPTQRPSNIPTSPTRGQQYTPDGGYKY
ncbi:unnamed protein product [Ceutorhynchus assimilis]|uniref:Uncharacterized protein n=1 Tax=Ceutorhynchus assimilis TaxID=467358 RepID=A0A9N9MNA3_9CUCU|nr:unnamed protein product [Ceutorhynchus assimilis]